MARSSRVVPIPFEVLVEEDDENAYEMVPSREPHAQLPRGLHLPHIPIKELGVQNSEGISWIPATAESLPTIESIAGESTTEADPKGKRFLPWISSEGSTSTAGDGATGDKGELLAYFKELTFSVDNINFATIDDYLENGSDINATSQSTGGNIMHEIAAHWDKNVADYLLKRGLDIYLKDKDGVTPLHVAASANHVEIVEWLADQGAELKARTNVEEQTPLHHAARYDSVRAMRILFDRGGDCEMVDYKGRTPLHLAAELDRTAAVECLISAPILADVRVQDHMGNCAIASMIRTMPEVALLALDQLHRVVPAKRKQYFLLNHLEPEVEFSCTAGVKTPFEVAVEEKRRNVLSHPVMQTLIAQKWKFVQWVFYSYLAGYLIFLVSWTLLIAFPSVQKKHEYVFPRDIWRIVMEFIAVVTYILQIVEEVIEVVFSKNKFKDYRKLRTKMLQDDLNNCAYVEERQFFESVIVRLHKTKPSYFTDPWNLIDLVTYVLMFVLIILHIADIILHSTTFAMWVARASCFVVLLIWFRLFKHARGFRIFGPLVAIITQSVGDMVRFFILYAILFVPYVVCFWVLFGGSQSAGLSTDDKEDLTAFYRVAIMMFRMGLVDDYPYSSIRGIDEAMAAILVLTFLLFIAVVGLNLFIALLSDTFQRVYDNAQSIALLEQAKLILSYEEKMCACFINRYLDHIHKNCSPHPEFYDDDEHFSKESSTEVKKITHQIHSIVSDLHAIQRNGSGVELRGVSEVFADYTDKQDSKLAHITKQLEELKTVLNAGRDDVAKVHAVAQAQTGCNPISYPPGSFTSIHPSMVHEPRGRQAWAATQQSTTMESAGATSLSSPSHPNTSPTRVALHNIFSQRQQHPQHAHLVQPLPSVSARKHSFSQERPWPAGYLATCPDVPSLILQRSVSTPGNSIPPSHRRVKNVSVQELEEIQWEKKFQPMKRKSNVSTYTET